MNPRMSRDRVQGFLDVDGRRIVNGAGEEILLMGWGLGNWLLCEGYMWQAYDLPRFDRPRRIEDAIRELAGEDYAEGFWQSFRERYIAQSDIRLMAEMGYNSVRIPINARLFLEEGPGIRFVEEGFRWLDRVLDWCEQYRLYAFIDLHGAPGGQTGANIDDSEDDLCRLFMEDEQFEKGLCLWERIAQRYGDRWIVGGYDLLNEPIRPVRYPGDVSLEKYVPRLVEFYEKCIARIRKTDRRHLITLEGHHWASETTIFDHVYDPRMVIHFHRYGCAPDFSAFRCWLELSEKLNVPLWLGETGENTMEWFSALIPLATSLNIGVNLWPWKKMNCLNSPCSVVPPADWHTILAYARTGERPARESVRKTLDAYLDSIRLEQCVINEKIAANVFRRPGCVISGADFDELPGQGRSWLALQASDSPIDYRRNTGMQLFSRQPDQGKRFGFDGDWARFLLRLREGEFACYSLKDLTEPAPLTVTCYAPEPAVVEISQDGQPLGCFQLCAGEERQTLSGIMLRPAEACALKIQAMRGTVDVEKLITG